MTPKRPSDAVTVKTSTDAGSVSSFRVAENVFQDSKTAPALAVGLAYPNGDRNFASKLPDFPRREAGKI